MYTNIQKRILLLYAALPFVVVHHRRNAPCSPRMASLHPRLAFWHARGKGPMGHIAFVVHSPMADLKKKLTCLRPSLGDPVSVYMKGSVKEPNKFHIYETEKITRKASDTAEYIELFGSSTRDRHARRRIYRRTFRE